LPHALLHRQRVSEAMTTVTQAYRFALDPTPTQRRVLASRCGAARVAYNWGLALVKTNLDQHRTDPSVRVPWTRRLGEAKLTLAERTFTCETCGLRLDRDLNAARNLASSQITSPRVAGRR
jgi:transposase